MGCTHAANRPIQPAGHEGLKSLNVKDAQSNQSEILWSEHMYVKGRPCGDAHGADSRLGQGERSMKSYFPKSSVHVADA